MKIVIYSIATLIAIIFSSCTETPKLRTTDKKENVEDTAAKVVSEKWASKDGKKLELAFNNAKGTAALTFNGDSTELAAKKAASGIWYTNEQYELRGKGNDIELKKDGKVVFTHTDDIVKKSIKNSKGQTLELIFNNTTNQAKIYLNGGEQIDMDGQKPASGIWYKNDNYELRGKGDHLELRKNDEIVFKN